MDILKQIPEYQENSFKVAFDKFDSDKKGHIPIDDFMNKLIEQYKQIREKGPTKKEIKEAKKVLDPDGTGKVTFENFVKFMKLGINKYTKNQMIK